jgi:hypothetical protein
MRIAIGIGIGIGIGILLGAAIGFFAPFLFFWTSNVGGSNPQLGLVSVFVGMPVGAIVGAVVGAVVGRRSRPGGERNP